MPSVIPYSPSLVLGNIVHPDALKTLTQISEIQGPIDQKEDAFNQLIALKRSIDMTIQELMDMSIDATDLIATSKQVGDDITKAAADYAKTKVDGLLQISKIKAIPLVQAEVESPIDYNKSQIKSMPLSNDSLKMNAQYFSFDENTQSAATQATAVKSFVSASVDWMGNNFSAQTSNAIQSQMNSQYSRHSIAGTLVISISCTHKDAQVFAPFILDVDKGIRAWNKFFPDDMIKTNDPANIAQISKQADTKDEKSLTLLSGATYGSCFIGMVHILNTTQTRSSETAISVAESMQAQFSVAGWFARYSGGFGVDSSFSKDVKNLLSTQNITSHCTLFTMGSIPSIKANDVNLAVQQFSKFDGKSSMDQLATLQGATAGDKDTVDSAAAAARTGGQMLAMKNSQIKGVLEALGPLEDGKNKMLDINSMMQAMDDYIEKALAGNIGVPLNYYLKPITKSQLAEMWVAKYYPGRYLAISGDDTAPKEAAAAAANANPN